jgi:hypothetical protein
MLPFVDGFLSPKLWRLEDDEHCDSAFEAAMVTSTPVLVPFKNCILRA